MKNYKRTKLVMNLLENKSRKIRFVGIFIEWLILFVKTRDIRKLNVKWMWEWSREGSGYAVTYS